MTIKLPGGISKLSPTSPHIKDPLPLNTGGSTIGGVPVPVSTVEGATAGAAAQAGLGITAIPFYIVPSATATAAQLLAPGAALALSLPMPFRGSVVGLALSGPTKTAGTATFQVYRNGVAMSGAAMTWTTGNARQTTSWPRGTYGFSKDNYLDVRLTTSGLSPVTALVVWLLVVLDPTEAV